MKQFSPLDQIKMGGRIVYNDGRPCPNGGLATLVAVETNGMTVQLDDRADTNFIAVDDKAWVDFIEVAG